jgi:hypothetical protein
MNRISDIVQSSFDNFYPEARKTDIAEVMRLGDVRILGATICEDFETEYGTHPLAVIAVENPLSGETLTFPTSAQVLLDKMRQAKAKNAFPVIGKFTRDKKYYDVR